MNNTYGYIRVSARDQNEDRQLIAMGELPIPKENIFLDKQTGKDLEQWRVLTKEKRVDIVVLDMPLLDTRRGKDLMGAFLSDIVLQVLSFAAENERDNIRQRQGGGIAAAKARGVRFGRPPRPVPDNFHQVQMDWRNKKITLKQAASACAMPVTTFYQKATRLEKPD